MFTEGVAEIEAERYNQKISPVAQLGEQRLPKAINRHLTWRLKMRTPDPPGLGRGSGEAA
jgi:hypothetical protein